MERLLHRQRRAPHLHGTDHPVGVDRCEIHLEAEPLEPLRVAHLSCNGVELPSPLVGLIQRRPLPKLHGHLLRECTQAIVRVLAQRGHVHRPEAAGAQLGPQVVARRHGVIRHSWHALQEVRLGLIEVVDGARPEQHLLLLLLLHAGRRSRAAVVGLENVRRVHFDGHTVEVALRTQPALRPWRAHVLHRRHVHHAARHRRC
mmetsp:Transcript_71783/g.207922  ORF Transcript_71783/g.207922 Transcript_71783/m.207922 type:complete len:202 (+) Transcript_71783:999-1604(+)